MPLRPFTQAAKKPKLKSFKTAAATKKTTKANGTATTIKKPNPFGFIAKGESPDPRAQQLKQVKLDIIDVNKRLIDAAKIEPKKFKVLDRLERQNKKGTDAWDTALADWDESMKLVDRLTGRMLGLVAARSNLEGQLSGKIQPRKKGRR